jgi:hypothetical protein
MRHYNQGRLSLPGSRQSLCLIGFTIFVLQLIQRAEIKRAQRAGGYADRRFAGCQLIPAQVTLPGLSGFFVILRRTIRAAFYTLAATYTLVLINIYNPIGCLFLNSTNRATINANRFAAVVAADGCPEGIHSRYNSCIFYLKASACRLSHPPEQLARFQVMFVLAGHLACLTPDTKLLFHIKG